MYSEKYHSTDLSNLSFLVTGGAGFIGSNLVEYLLKYNAKKVVVLDNLETGKLVNLKEFENSINYTFIEGDITDLEACEFAMEGIDYVLHQAALGSVPRSIDNPVATNNTNVNGFLNVLMASKNSRTVKRVVYAASSSTYGDSEVLPKKEESIGKLLSPYAVTKYVNELYADVFYKVYGLETIGLRYFNVFGPKQDPNGAYAAVIPKFIGQLLRHETITINGDGEHSRDFTFIENVVQANLKAILTTKKETINEVYNVGCGDQVSLNQLTGAIIENLKKIKFESSSRINNKEIRLGDVKHSLADISKANEALNYHPKYNFTKGIAMTVLWFYNQQNI